MRKRPGGVHAASRAEETSGEASATSKCQLGFTRALVTIVGQIGLNSLVTAGEVRGAGVNLSGADDVASVEPEAWLDGR